jgi:hypothetical protein
MGYWRVESLEYSLRTKDRNEFGMTESWAGETDISEIRGFTCFAKENISLRVGRSGDRIAVEARFSAPVQNGTGAHPASNTMGLGSPSRGKVAGACRWPLNPSSAEDKERAQLHLYSLSGLSWPVLGWTLPLPLPLPFLQMWRASGVIQNMKSYHRQGFLSKPVNQEETLQDFSALTLTLMHLSTLPVHRIQRGANCDQL